MFKLQHISKLLYDVFVMYQLVIEAYDTAYSGNKYVLQTTINIRRNLLSTIFNPAKFVTRIIDERLAPGWAINITVKTMDRDNSVRRIIYILDFIYCFMLGLKIKHLF